MPEAIKYNSTSKILFLQISRYCVSCERERRHQQPAVTSVEKMNHKNEKQSS